MLCAVYMSEAAPSTGPLLIQTSTQLLAIKHLPLTAVTQLTQMHLDVLRREVYNSAFRAGIPINEYHLLQKAGQNLSTLFCLIRLWNKHFNPFQKASK